MVVSNSATFFSMPSIRFSRSLSRFPEASGAAVFRSPSIRLFQVGEPRLHRLQL
jgi:hypothetical protein